MADDRFSSLQQLDAQAPVLRCDRKNSVAALTALAANFNAAVGPDGGFPVLERAAGGLRLRGVLALNELEHVLGVSLLDALCSRLITDGRLSPPLRQPTSRTSPMRLASSALVLRPGPAPPFTPSSRPSRPTSQSYRNATRSTSRRTWTRSIPTAFPALRVKPRLILFFLLTGTPHDPAALAARTRPAAVCQARRPLTRLPQRAGSLRRHDQ